VGGEAFLLSASATAWISSAVKVVVKLCIPPRLIIMALFMRDVRLGPKEVNEPWQPEHLVTQIFMPSDAKTEPGARATTALARRPKIKHFIFLNFHKYINLKY
jgi:hypothetical protein